MYGYLNCHVAGMHSVVIGNTTDDKLIRMFVAEENHELWRNTTDNMMKDSNNGLSIALHGHKTDITLIPLTGQVSNLIVTHNQHKGQLILTPHMKAWEFKSHILGQGGEFVEVGYPQPEHLCIDDSLLEYPVTLKSYQMHTIHVPKGETASWLIIESGRYHDNASICYSNADLSNWSSEGLYQPISHEQAEYFKQCYLMDI